MMRNNPKQGDTGKVGPAFSLVETLVVVALAAMILVATLGVYNRVRSDAAVILQKLDENRLPDEVLQRIAEDIDRIVAPGFDAKVQIRNKVDNGFYAAQLGLANKFYGGQPPRENIYEQVVWQTQYDAFEDAMILYRMHSGLNVEDKILDESKDLREQTLYIPVASGLTFFEVQAVENQELVPNWTQDKPPRGIRIGISFAPMEEGWDGRWAVPEQKILYRTVAVDRTRAIAYKFKARVLDANDFLMEDYGREEEALEEAEETEQPEQPVEDPRSLLPLTE